MTPTTRTEYDAKLDAIERIERQVRRVKGGYADADLIVYGKVPIKELAWTELSPEDIASAAMGGVTNEYRACPPLAMRRVRIAWEITDGTALYFSADGLRYGYYGRENQEKWPVADGSNFKGLYLMRPLGLSWSQIESLAGGEGRR